MPPDFDESENSSERPEALPTSEMSPEESMTQLSHDEPVLVSKPKTVEFQPGDLIGRYEFVRVLGQGGFGQVVEAFDDRLNRNVAIKFPRLDKFEEHALAFLEEARSVARLDHTSIIRVYNVEQAKNGLPFVVMEYVEGPTLAQVIRKQGLTYAQAVRYFLQIAKALKYAHDQTLIHRDIKPANVIISNKDDTAKLADFGMALHDLTPEENLADCPQGTPPYMSPEQIRGENHRLDRRTDIWGFGVLMYSVLTGRKPFDGNSLSELVQRICRSDPTPPTEINGSIPVELERICLRCIEKLMRDRYQLTHELVDDLVAFQETSEFMSDESFSSTQLLGLDNKGTDANSGRPRSSQQRNRETGDQGASETLQGFRVIPKGLRSFDTQDVEFFLKLLPGPKDRMGVPDSIRFWLSQLDSEATNPLTVGMIYGPSGCGKSSFVKAGLIPNLDESIRTIYLEASPENTESDLLTKIKAVAPNVVRDETSLPVVLSRIRRGQMMTGEKLLIVLDQFEQWLSVQSEIARQPLVEALRHCDGGNLCSLLLIRDDFWMSASQFMNRLDLRVQEGVNALGIPLFDLKHAKKVLTGYGRAIQALPDHGGSLDSNQKKFIDASIDQMADNKKVVPIHIAMFAQMLDPDSWRLSELKKTGGWQGIGIRFLNKIFSDKRLANSESICRDLLGKLLPDPDSKIKGAEKSLSELMPVDASEKAKSRLLRVLDLLDREFRIITPTEADESERYYQLAHDSLVVPIRTWLAQKEAETWQGRSRARITPLIGQWNERPENRFLPSLFEFVPIKLGVRSSALTDHERKYLASATRYYAFRGLVVALVMAAALFATNLYWKKSTLSRAKEHYSDLLRAPAAEVGVRLQMLDRYSTFYRDQLLAQTMGDDWSNRQDLHGLYARTHFADSIVDFPVDELIVAINVVETQDSENIIRLLKSQRFGDPLHQEIGEKLEVAFKSANSYSEKIRIAIVALHVIGPKLSKQLVRYHHDPELREQFIETFPSWHGPFLDVIAIIQRSSDQELVSALCKSMGGVQRSVLSEAELFQLAEALKEQYLRSSSPAVHSASEWALRKLGEELPTVDTADPGKDWFVENLLDQHSMTFVWVAPHDVYVGQPKPDTGTPAQSQLKRGFYSASKEVPVALFMEYFNSKKLELIEPTIVFAGHPGLRILWVPNRAYMYFRNDSLSKLTDQDLPISDVSWYEAVDFCNWLSQKEGKQPRYQFDRDKGVWNLSPEGDGYRLPSTFEFDALNRAGTSSKFFFGSSMKRLSKYACAADIEFPSPNIYVDHRGTRMPNNFGIFDSTGNTAEWCEVNEMNTLNEFACIRGGASTDPIVYLESALAMEYNMKSRVDSGIRLILDRPDRGE